MKRATTIEQKIQRQVRNLADKQILPANFWGAALTAEAQARAPRREPKPAALLRSILEQTYRVGNQWIFNGVVNTLAHQVQCSEVHAKRCIAHFVRCGVLTPTGRSNGRGKPKEYIVRVDAGEDVNSSQYGIPCS